MYLYRSDGVVVRMKILPKVDDVIVKVVVMLKRYVVDDGYVKTWQY